MTKKKTKFRGKTKKKYRKYTQKRRLFSFVDTTRSLPTPKPVLPTLKSNKNASIE